MPGPDSLATALRAPFVCACQIERRTSPVGSEGRLTFAAAAGSRGESVRVPVGSWTREIVSCGSRRCQWAGKDKKARTTIFVSLALSLKRPQCHIYAPFHEYVRGTGLLVLYDIPSRIGGQHESRTGGRDSWRYYPLTAYIYRIQYNTSYGTPESETEGRHVTWSMLGRHFYICAPGAGSLTFCLCDSRIQYIDRERGNVSYEYVSGSLCSGSEFMAQGGTEL